MAIVRNAANTIRKGRIGETTYYVSGGQQIARQSRNDSNFGESARRSEAQQSRRVMWANLVNFYKVSAGWMPKAFETKKRNQSDYNKFMAVNIGNSTIALTKDESAAGACIAAPYIVSQGSLPSIEIVQLTNQWRTNLAIGQLQIDEETTNAQLTAALEASNANVHAGMQLSFVSYQQSVDPLGTPRLICRCYEITLSRTSSDVVRDFLPEFCSQSIQGYLGTNNNISIGGFAYILSELVTGGLKVSTQQLVSTNSDLISQYSSSVHINEAIISYGLDQEVILSPSGTVIQEAEAQPVYLTKVISGSRTYTSGSYLGRVNNLPDTALQLVLSTPESRVGAVAETVTVKFANGSSGEVDIDNKEGSVLYVDLSNLSYMTANIASITVQFNNGLEVPITFSTQEDLGEDIS